MNLSSSLERVTALMPVKNGEKYLDSIMPQIISNLGPTDEIIVVNDNSVDNTELILRKWARSATNIRIIDSPETGLVNALNLGVRESSNRWIARFDVDDNYSEFRIRNQMKQIQKDDVVIFSDYSILNERMRYLGTIYSPVSPLACSISLINSERTAHPSALMNKEAVLSVGGYRTEDFLVEDLSLWLRLSRVGNMRSVPESLLLYSLNQQSVTHKNRSLMKANKMNLLEKIQINPLHISQISKILEIDTYKDTPHSNIRRLLFLRDVITLAKKTPELKQLNVLNEVIKTISCNPLKSGQNAGSLIWYKLVRDFHRDFPTR